LPVLALLWAVVAGSPASKQQAKVQDILRGAAG